MTIAMGLIRTAIPNLASECSTTICVGLDFAIATSEIGASCFLVAAITSTTCILATAVIIAHMLQVADTARETLTGALFFATIPDNTDSTATAIDATDLDEVSRAREIIATRFKRGGGRGRGGRCRCSLAALAVLALDCTTKSGMLCGLQTVTTNVIVTMSLVRTAVGNLATERSTTVHVGLDFAMAASKISTSCFFVTAITSTTCSLATSIIIAHMLQVADATRETFAGALFFATIPNFTDSTSTAIHATDLDKVSWTCEIVTTCLHCGGGGRACGCRGCRGLTTLLICACGRSTRPSTGNKLQAIRAVMVNTRCLWHTTLVVGAKTSTTTTRITSVNHRIRALVVTTLCLRGTAILVSA